MSDYYKGVADGEEKGREYMQRLLLPKLNFCRALVIALSITILAMVVI